jgi:hypothetical protein
MTADDAPFFFSPESFLSKFHRLDIFDAVCFMEGWVNTHTDAFIPRQRYVFIDTIDEMEFQAELLEST